MNRPMFGVPALAGPSGSNHLEAVLQTKDDSWTNCRSLLVGFNVDQANINILSATGLMTMDGDDIPTRP